MLTSAALLARCASDRVLVCVARTSCAGHAIAGVSLFARAREASNCVRTGRVGVAVVRVRGRCALIDITTRHAITRVSPIARACIAAYGIRAGRVGVAVVRTINALIGTINIAWSTRI